MEVTDAIQSPVDEPAAGWKPVRDIINCYDHAV